MSTQPSEFPAIPFSISQSFQNIRLLEVPDELLEIVTSTQQNLYFKSAPPPLSSMLHQTSSGTVAKEGNLHLCADDKIWAVKQVSTSNSLYVSKTRFRTPTSSVSRESGDDGDTEMEEALDGELDQQRQGLNLETSISLSAFAKPNSILELHAVPAGNGGIDNTVLSQIENLVPTISSLSDLKEIYSQGQSPYSLSEIYEHVAGPTSVITKILAQKCVFEISHRRRDRDEQSALLPRTIRRAYIASPDLLFSTWLAIVGTATINGVTITGSENIDILQFNSGELDFDTDVNMDKDEDDLLKHIHAAICKTLFRVSPNPGHFSTLGIQDAQTGLLDPRECARWVGNLILATTATTSNSSRANTTNRTSSNGSTPFLTKASFENRWEDLVPADWIAYCSVEVLMPACEVFSVSASDENGEDASKNKEYVRWRPFVLEDGGGGGDSNIGGGANAGSGSQPAGQAASSSIGAPSSSSKTGSGSGGGKNKRKWHEKFASQRNLKK